MVIFDHFSLNTVDIMDLIYTHENDVNLWRICGSVQLEMERNFSKAFCIESIEKCHG